jgi:hypothetical protein
MFSVSREDGIAGNFSGPQDPVDQPGPGYFNDTGNNWVRGANEDGRKPGFDNSPPRSKMRR